METEQLVKAVVTSLDTHKAQDIRVLAVGEVTSITDYFVIAAGTSTTQVRALTDYVDTDLGKQQVSPLRVEGYQTAQWTVLDYGTFFWTVPVNFTIWNVYGKTRVKWRSHSFWR